VGARPHTIERLTRIDDKHIAYEITVIDPKAYSEPITNKRVFTLRPEWELMEYACEENNKDLGKGTSNSAGEASRFRRGPLDPSTPSR
jgi:hypothetical protein